MLRLRSAGALRVRRAPVARRGRAMVLRRPSALSREGLNDGHRRTRPGSSHERQARAAAWVGGAGSGGHGGARPQGERMTILGIDPGKSGAVAVLDEGGDLLKVLDVPSTPEANGSRQLIDGESKGKNHVISIDPESPRHRGHPAALANKQRHSLAPEVLRERNCRIEERNDLR